MKTHLIRHFMAAIVAAALAACASTPDPADAVEERFAADNQAASRAFLEGDVATAVALWSPWAEKGRPEAQFGMGLAAEVQGEGPEGIDEALGWYRRAGEQGHSPANVRRAELLTERGETEEATAAYVHAAECGNTKAILVLNEQNVDYTSRSRCVGPRPTWARSGRRDRGTYGFPPDHHQPNLNSSIRVRSSAERELGGRPAPGPGRAGRPRSCGAPAWSEGAPRRAPAHAALRGWASPPFVV